MIVLEHVVKDLKGVHHQTLGVGMVAIALCGSEVITVLDELNEIIDTLTVYFREKGDDLV